MGKIAEKYLTDAVSAKRAQMIAAKSKAGDIDMGEIYAGLEMISKWVQVIGPAGPKGVALVSKIKNKQP